jgi:hypothetical protein
MVEGKPFSCANAGMALAVFFDEVDRTAIIFADELEMLDGDKYEAAADEDAEDADDAAFAEFLASGEFDED